MDRLRRRNPKSVPSGPSSMKPPRPPRGPSFQAPAVPRPLPEPSSPGGRPRKRVRFASEASSHQICVRQDANTGKRPQESHNVMPGRKLPAQKSTLSSEETPATPCKNEEIYHEQVNAKASHSEHGNNDTPQLNPHDYLTVHVHTPITQVSFEAVGISRNTEFFADILQRLGANSMIKKHRKESMRMMKVCGHTPTGTGCHFENMLDYRISDFDLRTKLRTEKESSSYATQESRQFMALPWGYNQGPSGSLDWKIDLPHRGNEARESMALPWVHTVGLPNSGWKRDTAHNQVSNLLLEDVQPHSEGKLASATELNCNVETRPCTYHGWVPMLSPGFSGSIPNRFFTPCQIEETHVVPYEISNTYRRPDPCNPLEQCFPPVGLDRQGQKEARFSHNYGAELLEQFTSSSVGLERQDQHGSELVNFDTGLLSSFDQLYAKCSASSFLDTRNGILNHSDFSYISNLAASESNDIVSNASMSCLNSIFSTSEHPFQLGSKRLHETSLAGLEEKYSKEAEIFDNSDIGPIQELDQLPAKFTYTSFSNYISGTLDHQHHLRYMPPKDSSSTLFMDANGACLNSLSPYTDHPCKQDGKGLCDSSTELWSSVHHLQSHGDDFGAVLGFMSEENTYNDLEDHCSFMLAEGNPNDLCTSDLPLFGLCSAMDGIREASVRLDGLRFILLADGTSMNVEGTEVYVDDVMRYSQMFT
uniref:Uncharacterized protein n=1 Tax=Oryza barthii TaxID=65489 RepID=A0A0D3F7N0_9ORYZ